MGYPTQGQIAAAIDRLTTLTQECESEINRCKQLAVHNGELLRQILKQLKENKNGI